MSIFEFLKDNPLVWILVLVAVVIGVIFLFVKYLLIDNWDKIFKRKSDKIDNDDSQKNDDENQE